MPDPAENKIRRMEQHDLERVLSWRNAPDVRRHMYTPQLIGMAEHKSWFEASRRDSRKHLLIFELAGEPAGFVNLTALCCGKIAEWGFYTAPGSPKGTGQMLGSAALAYAFRTLGLHKVEGQALASNARSIRFHQQLGFQLEGILRDHFFDGAGYHEVCCFGLLCKEWKEKASS